MYYSVAKDQLHFNLEFIVIYTREDLQVNKNSSFIYTIYNLYNFEAISTTYYSHFTTEYLISTNRV